MAPTPISVVDAAAGTPQGYTVSGGRLLAIRSAQAHFDGEDADGAWRPSLAVYAPGGVLLSRTWPSGVMQEGDHCDVTFAPSLEATAGTGELVATQRANWSTGADNPSTIVQNPCTLVGYIVDTVALTAGVRFNLYDDINDVAGDFVAAVPGPAGLGANAKLPYRFHTGITVEVLDAATDAEYAGAETIFFTALYTGQIS